MIYMKAPEIKALAREKMLGKYNTASAAFVLIQVLLFVANLIIRSVVDVNSVFGFFTYWIITFIISLIFVVFSTGELTIYLKFACGGSARATDVFSYFKVHPDKAIVMMLAILAKIILWSIPMMIATAIFIVEQSSPALHVLGLVIYVVSAIKVLIVGFELSQSYYLLLDFPQYTVKELMAFSKEIMKGHKKTLFRLYIGFIPYGLLAIASAGIGMLFVYPYFRMVLTEFYLDIIKEPVEEKPVTEAFVDVMTEAVTEVVTDTVVENVEDVVTEETITEDTKEEM